VFCGKNEQFLVRTGTATKEYSKGEILGRYLNTIYLGKGAYGIQSAARKYFSKRAAELNLTEAALLAGLIAAPERYDPVDDPEAAIGRRNTVLSRMRGLGMIHEPAYRVAVASPLGLRLAPEKRRYRAAYFVEHVKEQIVRFLAEQRFLAAQRHLPTARPEDDTGSGSTKSEPEGKERR
jgi:penicillin-binding protein 1A